MTDTETTEPAIAEIFLAVNENGEYDVGCDSEDAAERLRDSCGGDQLRIVSMSIDITAVVPEVIEVEAALPAREDGTFELTIKS
jgi:hypothetical protein